MEVANLFFLVETDEILDEEQYDSGAGHDRSILVITEKRKLEAAYHDWGCKQVGCTHRLGSVRQKVTQDSLAREASRPAIVVAAANASAARKRAEFAFITMRSFNRQYLNVSAGAVGEANEILRLQYVLAGEVFASKVERMDKLFRDAKRMGFKEIWLTDGGRGLWRWPVD